MKTPNDQKNLEKAAKPTISELAAKLQLSKGTVSLILNNKGRAFSEDTRRRVFQAARESGYTPDPLARALATGRSGFVALWIQNLVTSYYAEVAHAMEEALEQYGYQIAVTPFGRFDHNRERYFGTPVGMDGVIAHEIYDDLWPLLFAASARPVPVVTTGIFAPVQSRDHVQIDIEEAVTKAIRHLIVTGRPRIAYAAEYLHSHQEIRHRIYSTIMKNSERETEFIDLPGRNRASMRSGFCAYISEQGCPGAIFCHNDDTAIAAYRALCDLGLRVPDDCILVGCDGIPDTEYLPVPITTIVQPLATMSEIACDFLKKRLAEPNCPPQRITLPAILTIRASSSV